MPSTNKSNKKTAEKTNPVPVFKRVFSHCAIKTLITGSLPAFSAILCVLTALVSFRAARFLSCWLFIPSLFFSPLAVVILYIFYFKASFPRPRQENGGVLRSLVFMCAAGIFCSVLSVFISLFLFSLFDLSFEAVLYLENVLFVSLSAALIIILSYNLFFNNLYLICTASLSAKSAVSGKKHGFLSAFILFYTLSLLFLVLTFFLFSFADFSFIRNITTEGAILTETILWIFTTLDAAGILLFPAFFLLTLRNISKI